MGDRDLDELRQQARRAAEQDRVARDAAARATAAQAERQTEATARAAAAEDARRRRAVETVDTWHRLKFPVAHELMGLPWLFVGGALATVAGAVPNLGVRVASLALLALGVGLMARSFVRFRRWRARSPFTVIGWPELVERTPPPMRDRWQRVTLAVTLPARAEAPAPTREDDPTPYRALHAADADDDRAELVRAALRLFVDRANREFYASRNEDHKRITWTLSATGASGSANAGVLWQLYRACTGPLALVARERGGFELALTMQGDLEHVSVPTASKR